MKSTVCVRNPSYPAESALYDERRRLIGPQEPWKKTDREGRTDRDEIVMSTLDGEDLVLERGVGGFERAVLRFAGVEEDVGCDLG